MTQQPVCALATLALARGVDLLLTLVAAIACRPGARFVVALVDLCVGISKLDCDVADQLILESDGLDARDGLDDCRLSVSDVTDGANVDGGLPRNNLGGQRGEGRDVEVFGVGLGREMRFRNGRNGLCFLQGRLEGLVENLVIGLGVLGLVVGAGLGHVVAKLVAVGSHLDR